MGTTEEFLRLLVEIKGDQALAGLKKQLADLDVESAKLKAQFDAQAISEAELETQTKKLAATSASLKAALGESTNKMAGFGQSALQTGRVVQDFAQGGLGGILNNIEGLSLALGGGPGLAGVLTIVGVGFMVFKPQIMAAVNALGLFKEEVDLSKSSVEQITQRIKELSEIPFKLAVDMNEIDMAQKKLDKLKKDKAAFDELGTLRSEEQAEAGGRVTKALADSGEAEEIRKAMIAKYAEGMLKNDPVLVKIDEERAAARAKMVEIRTGEHPELYTKALQQQADKIAAGEELMRKRIQKITGEGGEAELAVGDIYGRAKSGKDDESVGEFADRLRGIGRGGIAEKLKTATPGAVRAERVAETGRKAAEEATRFEVKHEDEMAIHRTKAIDKAGEAVGTFAGKETARAEAFGEKMKAFTEKAHDYQRKQAEKGTTDEEAHFAAAQLRAAGGYTNARGQFVPLDEGGQREVLEADVRKRLPGLSGSAQKAVAGGIAGQAFADVDRQKGEMQALGTMSAMEINQALIANNEAILNKQIQELRGKVDATGRALNAVNITARHRQTTVPGS